jgi:hypothetical protein
LQGEASVEIADAGLLGSFSLSLVPDGVWRPVRQVDRAPAPMRCTFSASAGVLRVEVRAWGCGGGGARAAPRRLARGLQRRRKCRATLLPRAARAAAPPMRVLFARARAPCRRASPWAC